MHAWQTVAKKKKKQQRKWNIVVQKYWIVCLQASEILLRNIKNSLMLYLKIPAFLFL